MKKILSVLVCVLTLLLSACGTEAAEVPVSSPEPIVKTEKPAQSPGPEATESVEDEAESAVEDNVESEAKVNYPVEYNSFDNIVKSKEADSEGWTVAVK